MAMTIIIFGPILLLMSIVTLMFWFKKDSMTRNGENAATLRKYHESSRFGVSALFLAINVPACDAREPNPL